MGILSLIEMMHIDDSKLRAFAKKELEKKRYYKQAVAFLDSGDVSTLVLELPGDTDIRQLKKFMIALKADNEDSKYGTDWMIFDLIHSNEPELSMKGYELLVSKYNMYVWSKIHSGYESFRNHHEDFFMAGMQGLLAAAKNYDPRSPAAFTTYADPFIIGELSEQQRFEIGGSKKSRHFTALQNKLERTLADCNISEVTTQEEYEQVKEKTGFSDKLLKRELAIREETTSSYESVSAYMPDNRSSSSPEITITTRVTIDEIMKQIKPYGKKVYAMAYDYLVEEMPYEQIGEKYGMYAYDVKKWIQSVLHVITSDYN